MTEKQKNEPHEMCFSLLYRGLARRFKRRCGTDRRAAVVITQVAHRPGPPHFLLSAAPSIVGLDVVIDRRICGSRQLVSPLLRILVERMKRNGPSVLFVHKDKFRRRAAFLGVSNVFDDNVTASLWDVDFQTGSDGPRMRFRTRPLTRRAAIRLPRS